jgi:exodeoxyribonuclease-3
MYDGGDVNTTHPSYIPQAKKKPIIICGDLNVAANPIDLKNPQANQHSAGYTQQEREKFQNLLDAGFVDTFRVLHPDEVKYSWWSYMFKARERNAGWRIDYFLASEDAKDKIVEADILTDIQGSDHCPVLLRLDV